MPSPIAENIILRWHPPQQGSGLGEMWFLRGIHPDGSYYGEIHVRIQGKLVGTSVQGAISASQRHEIGELIKSLSQYEPSVRLPSGSWNGLIATGPIGSPVVVLKYAAAECPHKEIADKFARIVTLVEPHLAVAAETLRSGC
ncbi:hypothetical protein C5Y96_11155 [Blastopirellula marina]|uniref:Uncharacterized protein n=1 Tax=Blastopirellula marina TaxID=124 RepID=A0A2S8FMN0_9BACT|nr:MULTISPECIES: hypothetical protein [Pirellulaceae]PQO33397.1 hypothetical protein C5Y96_11155 [Blastopirellula marina]RCS52486.1 hypothetical protein DTL36_11165 [Bremerella cremea]